MIKSGAFTKAKNPVVVVTATLLIVALIVASGRPVFIGETLRNTLSWSAYSLISAQLLLGLGVLTALEYLLPARLTERTLSPSILGDAAYTFFVWPVTLAVIMVTRVPLTTFLDENLSWLVVDTTREWHPLAAGIAALAISDFVSWATHVIKHKVPLLWRFHIVHHSQTRMSAFTANRVHPLESLQDLFIKILPLFIFFPSIVASFDLVYITAFFVWWTRFQHTNIRTNLGLLRYILVTPQSHRVHHSTLEEHWNSNYSNVFSIWDRIFGFQHDDVTSYPTTGVNDPEFPEAKEWSVTSLCAGWVGQMLYPFDRDAITKATEGVPSRQLQEAGSSHR